MFDPFEKVRRRRRWPIAGDSGQSRMRDDAMDRLYAVAAEEMVLLRDTVIPAGARFKTDCHCYPPPAECRS